MNTAWQSHSNYSDTHNIPITISTSSEEERKNIVLSGLSDSVVKKILNRDATLKTIQEEIYNILEDSLKVTVTSKWYTTLDKKKELQEVLEIKKWYYARAYSINPAVVYSLLHTYRNTDLDDLYELFHTALKWRLENEWTKSFLYIAEVDWTEKFGTGNEIILWIKSILTLKKVRYTSYIDAVYRRMAEVWMSNIYKCSIEIIKEDMLRLHIDVNIDTNSDTMVKERNQKDQYWYFIDLDNFDATHAQWQQDMVEFLRKIVGGNGDLTDYIVFK